MSDRKVAFVTGASRGIGRAASIALADAGFDIAMCARTTTEGKTADGRPLPGSLETTEMEVEKRGRRALKLPMDLLDPESVAAAIDTAFTEWGHVDLLLNNGIYTGPGNMDFFLDVAEETIETIFRANFLSQIQLIQRVLPDMLKRQQGRIVNMVSNAGISDPPAPPDSGGWGYAYAASKAALHRLAGCLAVEHPNQGVAFFNLEPGFVMTEAMKLNDPDGKIAALFPPAPPSVPAAAIAWLASAPNAPAMSGETIFAQPFSLERELHPDWR
ncbi:MAG: SDR family oxidoreductase [Myxococcota bacterium]|nr:SDR family oxidoreductase [Myxococcota bacterium]